MLKAKFLDRLKLLNFTNQTFQSLFDVYACCFLILKFILFDDKDLSIVGLYLICQTVLFHPD